MKITPAASDSPVEAMVLDTVISSTVPFNPLNMAADITAAGIAAETVMPTFRPRYALAAAMTMDNTTPRTRARTVSSSILTSGFTYGTKSSSATITT